MLLSSSGFRHSERHHTTLVEIAFCVGVYSGGSLLGSWVLGVVATVTLGPLFFLPAVALSLVDEVRVLRCAVCRTRPVGILHVKLVEAKNLRKTDVFGSTDPFVEMAFTGDDRPQKSKVRATRHTHSVPWRGHLVASATGRRLLAVAALISSEYSVAVSCSRSVETIGTSWTLCLVLVV